MQSHQTAIPSTRTRRRRWRVPPALLHGPEALEGGSVLQEVGGSLSLVLWQALRDVVLWAESPPSERAGLFAADAERRRLAALVCLSLEAELEDALRELAHLAGQPERARAQRVALACRELAQWAEAENKWATALAFAQGAALTCPGDAAASFKVGQLARRQAQYARAESWLRRTVALARQSGDWISYALAFVALGNLYVQRGNFPMARKFHTRALRAAKRHSLHDIAGRALHDLFVIAVAGSRADEAEEYARAAYKEYGPEHPRIPNLAHDVAYFWMTQGYFARALRVFQALLPSVHGQSERIATWANVARAAGGVRDVAAFEEAWSKVREQSESSSTVEAYAEAMLELARGAASLALWDRAGVAAHTALEIAQLRSESRIQFVAESVLDSIQLGRDVETHFMLAAPSLPADERGERFAGELVRTLHAHAVAG